MVFNFFKKIAAKKVSLQSKKGVLARIARSFTGSDKAVEKELNKLIDRLDSVHVKNPIYKSASLPKASNDADTLRREQLAYARAQVVANMANLASVTKVLRKKGSLVKSRK